MGIEKILGKVRIESFGKPGKASESPIMWGYTVYAGTFNFGATKALVSCGHYELVREETTNHTSFHIVRLAIMDETQTNEADLILRTEAETFARIIAKEIGIEYIGFVN